ncbi:unnamed protein product [Diamesa serratosioi]
MIEFSVNDYDIWTYPPELDCPEELQTCVRFVMPPNVCLEICDTNIEAKSEDSGKFVKNAMFSMNDSDICMEILGELQVFKMECEKNYTVVGSYKFDQFNELFKRLVDMYAEQRLKEPNNSQPTCDTMKELVQLTNKNDNIVGTSMFTLRFSCFGSTINQNMNVLSRGEFITSPENNPFVGTRCYPVKNKRTNAQAKEHNCLTNKKCSSSESLKTNWCRVEDIDADKTKFDEFAAEINGNALIVRINKDNPSYLVTHVCGSEVVTRPCSDEPKCSSKYPSKCPSKCSYCKVLNANNCNSPEKYRCKTPPTRSICLQADPNGSKNVTSGKCKLPNGIELCQKGCNNEDIDVFVLKIGRKCASQNQKNEIELELRTPKVKFLLFSQAIIYYFYFFLLQGPEICEPRPKESREVQVIESEFEDPTKGSKKTGNKIKPKQKLLRNSKNKD